MSDDWTLHRGRVVARGGEGAAGAFVWVAGGSGPTPEIAIRCDGEGRFRLALPPGRYVVAARAPDGRSGSAEVEVAAGDDRPSIEIVIAD